MEGLFKGEVLLRYIERERICSINVKEKDALHHIIIYIGTDQLPNTLDAFIR